MAREIRRLGADAVEAVLAAAHLFDQPPTAEWTRRFHRRAGAAEPEQQVLLSWTF